MTDDKVVSKVRVPITLCAFGVPMLLDSIVLWIGCVLLFYVHTRQAGDITTFIAMYGFLTFLPWKLVHIVCVIGGIIVKLVSEKKWLGSVGIWLCLMSILHIIVRAFPFVVVSFCELGKSV